MNSSDWVSNLWQQVIWYAGLGRYCIADAGRFDECEMVWAVIGAAIGIIGVVTLFYIGRHFLRERAAFRRAWEKKQAELAVAPPEIIAQAKWSGDSVLGADMSQEEMIRRIKEAKAQKKFADLSAPDKKNI
ncbi:MAG: hypothetical protein ABL878_08520 [Burkholderiales bacterium]